MKESEKSLDPQLWHACAGPMVQIPPLNSKVFYFPQGHAEHSLAAVDFPSSPPVPALVLCRVASLKFMADTETDEVYAKILLMPLPSTELDIENDTVFGSDNAEKPASFAKTLTQSDANNGGGFSVPRYCAETIFPSLDYTADPPVQTVVAVDVHGETWKFRHIYRGTPRRHLLTTGWSTFVNHKKLVAGDSIVFLRSENGGLCVGIRRAKRGTGNGPEAGSPFLSFLREDESKMMMMNRNGDWRGKGKLKAEAVLQAATLAASGQPFEVVYYPRASTPEFCVKASSVKAAMRVPWCCGMRFKMAFETEDSSRISWFMGTLSSVQVVDPIRWPNSPWRLLQVTWDEPDLLQNVKRVSPWLVELVSNVPAIHLSPFSPPRKKSRFPQHLDFPLDGQFPMSAFSSNGNPHGTGCPLVLSDNAPAGIQGARHAQFGLSLSDLHLNNKLQSGLFLPGFQRFDPHSRISDGIMMARRPNGTDNLSCLLTIGNSNVNEKSGNTKRHQFLLFGQPILTEQQLSRSCSSEVVSQVINGNSSLDGSAEKTKDTSDGSRSSLEKSSTAGFLWHQDYRSTETGLDIGHCKVFLDSEDVGRTLDLSVLGSYEELYRRLANMFGIERSKMLGHVLYRDATGAVKQTGEEPFSAFMKTAKRLTIRMDSSNETVARWEEAVSELNTMKPLVTFIFGLTSFFIFVSLFTETVAEKDGVYIVYMGAAPKTKGSLRHDHAQLLSSLLKRNKNALVRSYKNGFSGFAARLSAEEAHSIAQRAGVVSVFPDPVLELHTTRSWDFLNYQTSVVIDSNPNPNSNSTSNDSGAIIGILDTGIWPESESFNDKAMGPIPSRWNGTCAKAQDFNTSNCNKKIIGARSYEDDETSVIKYQSPRDMVGHGTHVASTAAGSEVQGVSYYGLAEGTAKGGSPGSRIAMYRVCSPNNGCRGSSILAAFDDAIADGVDVLSLSLGAPSFFKPEIADDPIALGAFHAVQHGITVVCSAGNDGPDPGTVVNAAPWIVTVAASTIDRAFESDVVLGDNTVIKGEGINFANIQKSPVYPIVYGKSAKKKDADVNDSRNCNTNSLDQELVKGKIVVCENLDKTYANDHMDEVKQLGGIGVVLIDYDSKGMASSFGTFPMTVISSEDGAKVLSYINSTKNPVATILRTTSPTKYTPAPIIAYFSSRGPSTIPENILKPDIAAPGVNILAAWMGNDTAEAPEGKDPPLYNLISGTSMACPHVSGIAATVKSKNPTWSPSAIRSAIMTTANQINNLKAPITTEKGVAATPYDFGAGEVSPTGPLQPGLVYETTAIDYLNFLCYHGYNITTIKTIANTIPDGFTCPKESSIDLISNINYPSIAITNFNEKAGRKVNRTLTNVAGDGNSVYAVTIDSPANLDVKVVPNKLQFTKNGDKSSYEVSFSAANPLKEDVFGSIAWSNGKYKVRSPFAVSSKRDN